MSGAKKGGGGSAAANPLAFTWGSDSTGQLGDNNALSSKTYPVMVSTAGLSHAVDIEGGDTNSLALDQGRKVWTWADNGGGQLGTNTMADSPIPVQVPNLTAAPQTKPGPGNVYSPSREAIASEGNHDLVVDSSGAVWAWGANDHGQLGQPVTGPQMCGSDACSRQPVKVSPLPGIVFSVGAGANHSLAVVGDCSTGNPNAGKAYAWGANTFGQLGDNTTTDRVSPVPVKKTSTSVLAGVAKIVGGGGHTLALLCNGTVMAWGHNGKGQLGTGTTTNSLLPTQVLIGSQSPLKNVIDIAAGAQHSMAVDKQGRFWSWGSNNLGQLCGGPAPTVQTFATALFSGAMTALPPTDVPRKFVAGGNTHSLVLMANNEVRSCGAQGPGKLGNCSLSSSSTPVSVLIGPACASTPAFTKFFAVAAGEAHSLALADPIRVGEPTPSPTETISTTTAPPTTVPGGTTPTPTPTSVPGGTVPPTTPTPTPTPTRTIGP